MLYQGLSVGLCFSQVGHSVVISSLALLRGNCAAGLIVSISNDGNGVTDERISLMLTGRTGHLVYLIVVFFKKWLTFSRHYNAIQLLLHFCVHSSSFFQKLFPIPAISDPQILLL